MPNNEYSIKLISSPFQPSLEVAGDLVIKLSFPYSSDKVTIEINPNPIDYRENQDSPAIMARQVMVTTKTGETQKLQFDFAQNKVQNCKVSGKDYELELVDIGKINQSGKDCPTFSFLVREG